MAGEVLYMTLGIKGCDAALVGTLQLFVSGMVIWREL